MQLPSQRPSAERYRAGRELLDLFLAKRPDDPISWIMGPVVAATLRARATDWTTYEPLGRVPESRRKRLKRTPEQLGEPGFDTKDVVLAGGCLFYGPTGNQQRSQAPIRDRIGTAEQPPYGQPSKRRAKKLDRAALKAADQLIDLFAANRPDLPLEQMETHRRFLRTARALVEWEALLDASEPSAVVIGSTQQLGARAGVQLARERSIPTVFLPHAPLSELTLNDLPVDYVGLRGSGDVDVYGGVGASPGRLDVVGDAGANPGRIAKDASPGRPVMAVSPNPPETLAEMIQLVHAALGEGVVLAPHPRSDIEWLQTNCPNGWEIWPDGTQALLDQGPPVLIQHGSGSGLDALVRGVPTIGLVFPDSDEISTMYAFQQTKLVPDVSTDAALRSAVDAAAATTPEGREELREWAARWVDAFGQEAAERGEALVKRAIGEGPGDGPIWDAWGVG